MGAHGLPASDLALLVQRMRTAEGTEFLHSDFVRLPLLVFGGRIIAPLAAVACQTD